MFEGYSLPPSAGWTLPNVNRYPKIEIAPTLRSYFGFKSQTVFPEAQTIQLDPNTNAPLNLSFLSDTYPVVSPVFCYQFACNMINSPFSSNPQIFHQMPLTKGFGSLIEDSNQADNWLSIVPASYQFLDITVFDDDGQVFVPNDPEFSMSIMFRYDE